jgi:DMSO/TMAO reductase YedYZ molybdopterin-dependent catalytic subunit
MTDETDADVPQSKLTRSKQQWAREGRFLTGRTARPEAERLPPGQHRVRDWPVLDLGVEPGVSQADWRLDVSGLVDHPVSWNWSQFSAQAQAGLTSDIHCVTSWSRFDNRWQGVTTHELLGLVRPRPEARFVVLHAYDGYTTNLSLEDFSAEGALLAHAWEGAPLTAEHGGPVRLVVPHLYFWKSAKWLRGIELRGEDEPGFWEVRGYHNRGDPWTEQRYSDDG